MDLMIRSTRIRLSTMLAVQRGEAAQDMVEYALLAALIAVVAIGVIILIGPYLVDVFGDVVNGFSAA